MQPSGTQDEHIQASANKTPASAVSAAEPPKDGSNEAVKVLPVGASIEPDSKIATDILDGGQVVQGQPAITPGQVRPDNKVAHEIVSRPAVAADTEAMNNLNPRHKKGKIVAVAVIVVILLVVLAAVYAFAWR